MNLLCLSGIAYTKELEELQTNLSNITTEYNNLSAEVDSCQSDIDGYQSDISNYLYNLELYTEGSTESLQKIVDQVGTTYTKNGETVSTSLKRQIQEQQSYNKQAKEAYEQNIEDCNQTEAAKNLITQNSANKRLQSLAEELSGMTSTTEENSEDVKEAWKQLAQGSYDIYYDYVSQLPTELQNVITEMTGVPLEKTEALTQSTATMMEQVLNTISQDEEFKKEALENLESYLAGLEDSELRALLKEAGVENADNVIQGIKEGNLAEDEGEKILTSLQNGLENNTLTSNLFSAARGIASKLSSILSVSAKVSSDSLPGHKEGLEYVPYDDYVARLHKGERVLTAKENQALSTLIGKNTSALNNNILTPSQSASKTSNFNFYVQKMDEANLKACFNYINQKFGSLY